MIVNKVAVNREITPIPDLHEVQEWRNDDAELRVVKGATMGSSRYVAIFQSIVGKWLKSRPGNEGEGDVSW